MKKRNILIMLLLLMATLGLYSIYYLVKTRDEMMTSSPKVKIKSAAFLYAYVVLVILSAVLSGLGYKLAGLFVIVGLILYLVWAWSYSQGVETITNGKCNAWLALALLVLLSNGIGILVIQYLFNQTESQAARPTGQVPAV